MRPGDELRVEVWKADGRLFRWWATTVERLGPGPVIVTWNSPGHVVHGRTREWVSRWGVRTLFWTDRPYNLLEVYYPNGPLRELYVHIAGRPTLDGIVLSWFDYELDVVMDPGGPIRLEDEDEFEQAAVEYGYSPEFQAECHRIADDVAGWLPSWRPG